MCGTHLDPQYLMRLFTMTVKENGPMCLPGPTSL